MTSTLAPTGGHAGPRPIREPDPWVQMLGMMQVPFEFGAFLASMPFLPALKRGDGHPVLVLPGFTHMVPDPVVVRSLETRMADFFTAHLRP